MTSVLLSITCVCAGLAFSYGAFGGHLRSGIALLSLAIFAMTLRNLLQPKILIGKTVSRETFGVPNKPKGTASRRYIWRAK